MATCLSTRLISTPSCYGRGRLAVSPFLPASLSFSRLSFDPFSVRRKAGLVGGSFVVRSSMGSADEVSEAISVSIPHLIERAEGLLYTLADAVATVDPTVADSAQTTQTTNSDWLGGITNLLESFLKTLQGGLQNLHVPYSFGFAIIMLTVIVKALTLPLTQKQVESSMAMQSLAPKVKAIQERYAGNQERIQLETSRLYKDAGVNPLAGCLPTLATLPVFIGLYRALSNVANEGLLTEGFFWIPSLAGPTTIAARQSGSGISWLFPFVDGQPPLGWHDTTAYLVLPLLLVASQYVSMQIIQTPQMDNPSQKNTQLLLKFLPLMIGYFSLSVPSGLSLYWFVNNLLSTGQQLYFKKIRAARAADSASIISAGQALRSGSTPVIQRKERRAEKLKQIKAEKVQKKGQQDVAVKASDESLDSASIVSSDSEDDTGVPIAEQEAVNISSAKDSLEEMYSKSGAATSTATTSKRSKRSKRRRSV